MRNRPAIMTLNDPRALRICKELADEIGLNESIILLQLDYLIGISNTKEIDGELWTYQSLSNWMEMLPLSKGSIERALNELKRLKLIKTGNYNKRRADRTIWYTINWEEAARLKSIRIDYEILTRERVRRRASEMLPLLENNAPEPDQSDSFEDVPVPSDTISQNGKCNSQNGPDISQNGTTISQNGKAISHFGTTLPIDSLTEIPPKNSALSAQTPSQKDLKDFKWAVNFLRDEMDWSLFLKYVSPCSLVRCEGSVYTVLCEDDDARKWMESRVIKVLQGKLSALLGHPAQIRFVVMEAAVC